jgi:hypothetical protein
VAGPNSSVRVNVASTPGKRLATYEFPLGPDLVESEAVTLTDSTGNEIVPASQPTQAAVLASLEAMNSLVPSAYDYIALGYTGTDLTSVVYKLGGVGGVTVSTLTLGYAAGVLVSIAKS